MNENLKYNTLLKEYGITKKQFKESNRIVKSNNIYGKLINIDNNGSCLMGFIDGGCVIINQKELYLYENFGD
jgi:tRNA G26 N,N-dimethylase Trm1